MVGDPELPLVEHLLCQPQGHLPKDEGGEVLIRVTVPSQGIHGQLAVLLVVILLSD